MKLFIAFWLTFFFGHLFGQQDFRFQAIIKSKNIYSADLFVISETTTCEECCKCDNAGIKTCCDKNILTPNSKAWSVSKTKAWVQRDGEYLRLKLWPFSNPSATALGSGDNNSEFAYKLSWKNTKIRGTFYKIPFRYSQLCATTMPFRIRLNTKEVTGDFLNFNATYLTMRGNIKLFKNEKIKQRYTAFGLGPYIGFTEIEKVVTEETTVTHIGSTYGVTAAVTLYKVNLVAGVGIEHDMFEKKFLSRGLYVGFGIGFSLVNGKEPEIEDAEDKLKMNCCDE